MWSPDILQCSVMLFEMVDIRVARSTECTFGAVLRNLLKPTEHTDVFVFMLLFFPSPVVSSLIRCWFLLTAAGTPIYTALLRCGVARLCFRAGEMRL